VQKTRLLRNVARHEAVHQGTELEAVKRERGRDSVAGHETGQGDKDDSFVAHRRSGKVTAELKKAEQGQRVRRRDGLEERGVRWTAASAKVEEGETYDSEGSGHTDRTPS
jgi:hypothetical protein